MWRSAAILNLENVIFDNVDRSDWKLSCERQFWWKSVQPFTNYFGFAKLNMGSDVIFDSRKCDFRHCRPFWFPTVSVSVKSGKNRFSHFGFTSLLPNRIWRSSDILDLTKCEFWHYRPFRFPSMSMCVILVKSVQPFSKYISSTKFKMAFSRHLEFRKCDF